MSAPEIAALIVLGVIALVALFGWRETTRLLERQIRADEELLAQEHGRPHGNVLRLLPPLDDEEAQR